jgi:hypothetical protein
MSNNINLIKMFVGLSHEQAVELAERLREVAESTDDNQLIPAVQAEFEKFQQEQMKREGAGSTLANVRNYPSRGEGLYRKEQYEQT